MSKEKTSICAECRHSYDLYFSRGCMVYREKRSLVSGHAMPRNCHDIRKEIGNVCPRFEALRVPSWVGPVLGIIAIIAVVLVVVLV